MENIDVPMIHSFLERISQKFAVNGWKEPGVGSRQPEGGKQAVTKIR